MPHKLTDEVKKQVFWLRGHPTCPALPRCRFSSAFKCSGLLGRSSLVTAALPSGILTRFPILPQPFGCEHFFSVCNHIILWSLSKNCRYVVHAAATRQGICTERRRLWRFHPKFTLTAASGFTLTRIRQGFYEKYYKNRIYG